MNFELDLRPENDFDYGYWRRLKFSFPSMVHRLTTVKISGFMCPTCMSDLDRENVLSLVEKQNKEIALVRFFLTNAVELKKMSIQFCDRPLIVGREEWSKILVTVSQKLKAVPRASSCAELSIMHK